jgi:hypothetical protein
VIAHLCKWGLLGKQSGGLESPLARLAAAQFMVSICDTVAQGKQPWSFRLFLTVDWKSRWPRPSTLYGDDFFDLQVNHQGLVILAPLFARGVVAPRGSCMAVLHEVVCLAFPCKPTTVSIYDLLKVSTACP